jgi:hypothetical protein
MSWAEPVATACNLLANAAVLRAMRADAFAPVPRAGLALQVGANACWLAYAAARRDPYLAAAAATSLAMQAASLRLRAAASRKAIPADGSREALTAP